MFNVSTSWIKIKFNIMIFSYKCEMNKEVKKYFGGGLLILALGISIILVSLIPYYRFFRMVGYSVIFLSLVPFGIGIWLYK